MIGKTLAHYEIASRLGKGGMGEVGRGDVPLVPLLCMLPNGGLLPYSADGLHINGLINKSKNAYVGGRAP